MAFALLDFGHGWDLPSLGIISRDNNFTVLPNQNIEGSIFRPHKTLCLTSSRSRSILLASTINDNPAGISSTMRSLAGPLLSQPTPRTMPTVTPWEVATAHRPWRKACPLQVPIHSSFLSYLMDKCHCYFSIIAYFSIILALRQSGSHYYPHTSKLKSKSTFLG